MTPGQARAARRIQAAHPGWRAWVSDEGWWYATRTGTRCPAQPVTVAAPDPRALAGELAEAAARGSSR